MKKYIVFDIGGTMIKYGLIDGQGSIIDGGETPSEAMLGGAHIIEKVIGVIKDYGKENTLSGIGISTAGMVDAETGTILYANKNIPSYTGTRVKDILEKEFDIPCEVENDVVCAGLAEQCAGAAKGSRGSVCLTIGTGIGCCIMIDGKVFHGAGNSAGEVGYMNMFGTQFEELASCRALVCNVAKQKKCSPEELDGIKIFEMAKAGDHDCIHAIEKMCEMLGYGIANICYVINPEAVILGGGITGQKEYLYERIRRNMDRYLISSVSEKTQLRFASLGNRAGMLGAYYNFCMKH